jgi:hypothetical protein
MLPNLQNFIVKPKNPPHKQSIFTQNPSLLTPKTAFLTMPKRHTSGLNYPKILFFFEQLDVV